MEVVDGVVANTTKGTVGEVLRLARAGRPKTILDAAAGHGAFSLQAKKANMEVTALDLDRPTFTIEDVRFVEGNLDTALPFASESFDCVVCIDAIEHLENAFHVIREFHRVLVPGGRLIISTPNISAWRSRMRYLVTGFHNKGKRPLTEEAPTPMHHINMLSYPELRYVLCRWGFRIETISTNRVKAIAYPYALLYPLIAFGTWFAFLREKDAQQRAINREIFAHLLSWPLAMGETMIVVAPKR